ncbi:MAG: hypothetical protein CL866_02600 [Cycloclasticus sp.]|nr:hypothetical protein [Cycloclasticus sp.]MBG95747.1 hypothetical protein [Cycloclasticus sp.]HAI96910.1 hypothetical protein [Methylococcaceae bacterium]
MNATWSTHCRAIHSLKKGEYPAGLKWQGLLNEADFVVGNDTGPSHIASCLGKAGLALFGNKTSAARAEIQRGSFKAIEVDNLADLSVDSVVKRIYGD